VATECQHGAFCDRTCLILAFEDGQFEEFDVFTETVVFLRQIAQFRRELLFGSFDAMFQHPYASFEQFPIGTLIGTH
jgi:hypothetical protein